MKTASRPKIRRAAVLALAATAFAVPAAGQDSASEFKLQPGPTNTPEAQGPVTAGVPRPRVAQPEPSPTPAPVPTIQPPLIALPTPVATPTPQSAATAPAARPSAQPGPTATATAGPTQPQPTASASPIAVPSSFSSPAPLASPLPALATPQTSEESGGLGWWPWLAGVILLGAGAAAGYAFARRRRVTEGPLVVPEIERPRVPANGITASTLAAASGLVPTAPATPGAPAQPAAPAPDGEGLTLALEARQLSLTLTSAALAYRVTLTNNGTQRLSGITVAGDMISAHSSLSKDEQLANAASELMPRHEIDSIAAGETTQVTGEFRLPFTLIRPIRKGKAVMFVPLARLRVNAADGGNGAVLLTALVGQRSRQPGAGLQPFRLDYGPRIYREVTQRIFS